MYILKGRWIFQDYFWDYEFQPKDSTSREMYGVAVSKEFMCSSHTSINNSARIAWHASNASLPLPTPSIHFYIERGREEKREGERERDDAEWINSSMKHEKRSLCHYVAHLQLHSSDEAVQFRRSFRESTSPLQCSAARLFPRKWDFFTRPGDHWSSNNGVITDGSTGKQA